MPGLISSPHAPATILLRWAIAVVGVILFSVFSLRLLDNSRPLVYESKDEWKGNEFWPSKTQVTASPLLRHIPLQIPGPADSFWAGNGPKAIRLLAPFDESFTVNVSILESHESSPPTLELLINGKLAGTLHTQPGGGLPPNEWRAKGKRQTMSVTAPSSLLVSEGPQEIVLRSVEGSWVAIDWIEVAVANKNVWPTILTAVWILLGAIVIYFAWRGWKPLTAALSNARPMPGPAWIWPLLGIVAFLAPSGGYGIFTGIPISSFTNSAISIFILPLLFLWRPAITASRIAVGLAVMALSAKIALLMLIPSAGVCLKPQSIGADGSPKNENTYEGVLSGGCFQMTASTVRGAGLPVEFFNRLYFKETYEGVINSSFYYQAPAEAEFLLLEAQGQSYLETAGGKKFMPAEWGATILPIGADNRNGKLSTSAKYSARSLSELETWRFSAVFLDKRMRPLNANPYIPAFWMNGSNSIPAIASALAVLSDIALALWALTAVSGMVALWLAEGSGLVACSATLLAWFAWGNGYLFFSAIPYPANLLSLIPLEAQALAIASIIGFAWLKADKLSINAAFTAGLLIAASFYAGDILAGSGAVNFLSEGDDWRTFQRFANMILNGDFVQAGTCPPSFNLPFAYFTAFLHLIGGQSMSIQRSLDIFAITAVMTMIFSLGVNWGLSPRLALAGAVSYPVLSASTGYSQYVGIGLTEHVATLAMCAIFFLFMRQKRTGERWTTIAVAGIAFVAMGWRPNFMPCYLFGFLGLLDKEDALSFKRLVGALWARRNAIALVTSACIVWVLLFSYRNYATCGQFVYIAPLVKNMYELTDLKSRMDSITAMTTGMTQEARMASRFVLPAIISSAALTAGWAIAMARGVAGFGMFRQFPLPLSLIAWTGFIIYAFKFSILAGYNVRWGIPLLPFWLLSFMFGVSMALDAFRRYFAK